MAGSVESVPTYPILFVMREGNRIVERVRGQRLVKCSIKDGHLRFAREKVGGHPNPERVRRVMERRQDGEFFDLLKNTVVD